MINYMIGAMSINSAGVTLPWIPYFIYTGSSLTLLSNVTLNTTYGAPYYGGYFTSQNCTLNLNGYTLFQNDKFYISANGFTINGPGTIKNSMASGEVFYATSFSLSTNTGDPTFELTDSSAGAKYATFNTSQTEAGALNLKVSAGSGTFYWTGAVRNADFTGFAGTWTNNIRTIYGSLTVSSGMTVAAGTNTTTFAATSGTKTITSNGKTLDFPITFSGAGGTWQLQDAFTIGSTRTLTLTNGTIDLNGKTLNSGTSFTTAAGTKNITFNGGTLVCQAVTATAFNNAQPTNFTTTAGTGTGKISMTGATAKTFVGGGSTYNCTLENAGAGALTVTGSNTFTTISNSVQPTSFLFTAGTTNTVTNFNVSGTSGNLVTIGSSTTSNHTLSSSSGIISVSYCSISRSTATGGAQWRAYTTDGNVNGGNNVGWLFAPAGGGLFFGSNF